MRTDILASIFFSAITFAHPTEKRQTLTDIDILQYALTLEHLEDKFYREGLANYTQANFQDAGFNATFYNNLKEVSYDETVHVSFLSTVLKSLGATPVAECEYSFGVTDVKSFVALAAVLEGVGVSAYLGAAASIVDKTYLTAAASILTVESRHSSYLRASQQQPPIPQPFGSPLDFNQVYTLAAPFITSCPSSNGALPVMAFPSITLDGMSATTNSTVSLSLMQPLPASTYTGPYYAAWIGLAGPTIVSATMSGSKFTTVVPPGFHGQSFVVITNDQNKATDDTVVAGPAIVEVLGATGTE